MTGAATVHTGHRRQGDKLELLELAGIPAALLDEQVNLLACSRDFSDIARVVNTELRSHNRPPIPLLELLCRCRRTRQSAVSTELASDACYQYSVELAALSSGETLLMLKRCVDFHAADKSEQMLAQITQLKAAKEDLEQLAFIACHDLRSPLRALTTIPLWISADVQETFGYLPDTIDEHTGWLVKQAKRLTTMLDDLLVYATIGSSRETSMIRLIDWQSEIQCAWEQLNTGPEFALQLKLQHHPCLLPYNECTLAAKHLLRNAVKHHAGETAEIEFETLSDGRYFHLTVRDDGLGIPAEQRQKALKIFGTLQSRDDIEGTGIGLALCKKIAASLQGTLTLSEGLHGRGTSVTLSIPYASEKT